MVSTIFTIIKTLIILGILVIIHEGGHFLAAKFCKIKVNEFSIGFGKLLWSKQGKSTKYSIRLIPLGGFVSMEGEEEYSEAEGSFSKAGFLKKLLIVSAGPIVNIVFGLLIYFILILVSYNFQTAISATGEFFGLFLESIKMLFTGAVSADDLTGPVGIGAIVSQAVNIADLVYLIAVISLSLGLTNLLPIPPLDRRKTTYICYRSYQKKAFKGRNIIKNTNVRICLYNRTFSVCYV